MEKDTPDYLYYVRKTNIEGMCTYGAVQKNESYNGYVGYIWSSRPGVINKLFNTKLVYVYYNNTCCAIDIEHLKLLLVGTGYEVSEIPTYDNDDIVYKIVETE